MSVTPLNRRDTLMRCSSIDLVSGRAYTEIMKVRRIMVVLTLLLMFVSMTSFTYAYIISKTASSASLAQAALSIEDAANLDMVSSFALVAPANSSKESEPTVKSKAWDKIEFTSRRLTNNIWGAPDNEMLNSGVYLNPNNSFGWYWNRQEPKIKTGDTGVKPIYPSVRCGGSPWDPSNTAYFPVRLTEIKSLKLHVMYNYPVVPTGSYNLAYDIFLSDTNQPDSSPHPEAEVMIWLHATLTQSSDTYRGDFTDGINTYKLYSFVMSNGRQYYSFVLKEPSQLAAQHTVDAGRLINNLALDPNWYIHGVELGNEIVNGSGDIEISKFNVILNGHDL